MDERTWLAERFEENRVHMQAVAYRMLGSLGEAEDAVQEAWLRFSRAGAGGIENLPGWLTTVVARVCLDMLRARGARREEALDARRLDSLTSGVPGVDPEYEALLADSVGLALLVVLNTLAPAERLAFVLHDIFAVPFSEIASIVERSPEATRKLASRARQRVRGADPAGDADLARQQAVVEAFLAAAREGDFDALLTVLDPDVVFRADRIAAAMGGVDELQGATAVAKHFRGRAQGARVARVNGAVGAIVAPSGRLLLVLGIVVRHGRIVAIDVAADPVRLREIDLAVL